MIMQQSQTYNFQTQEKDSFNNIFTKDGIVKNTTVFPIQKILSRFARKPRFNLHQNCVTNSIYTRIQMAIVVCVELALNVGYERIWFSRIRVEFQKVGKNCRPMTSRFLHTSFLTNTFFALFMRWLITVIGATHANITRYQRSFLLELSYSSIFTLYFFLYFELQLRL